MRNLKHGKRDEMNEKSDDSFKTSIFSAQSKSQGYKSVKHSVNISKQLKAKSGCTSTLKLLKMGRRST